MHASCFTFIVLSLHILSQMRWLWRSLETLPGCRRVMKTASSTKIANIQRVSSVPSLCQYYL